jgi:hypothetical protein
MIFVFKNQGIDGQCRRSDSKHAGSLFISSPLPARVDHSLHVFPLRVRRNLAHGAQDEAAAHSHRVQQAAVLRGNLTMPSEGKEPGGNVAHEAQVPPEGWKRDHPRCLSVHAGPPEQSPGELSVSAKQSRAAGRCLIKKVYAVIIDPA